MGEATIEKWNIGGQLDEQLPWVKPQWRTALIAVPGSDSEEFPDGEESPEDIASYKEALKRRDPTPMLNSATTITTWPNGLDCLKPSRQSTITRSWAKSIIRNIIIRTKRLIMVKKMAASSNFTMMKKKELTTMRSNLLRESRSDLLNMVNSRLKRIQSFKMIRSPQCFRRPSKWLRRCQ